MIPSRFYGDYDLCGLSFKAAAGGGGGDRDKVCGNNIKIRKIVCIFPP